MFHAKECIGEAKVQGLIEHRLVKGVNGTRATTHCCTVTGNIKRTKVIHGCFHHTRHTLFVTHVGNKSLGLPASTDYIVSRLIGRLLVEIDNQNSRTFARELHRYRTADTNTGARHQRCLS